MWSDAAWANAAKNSVIIGFFSTIVATVLGTVAALGLSRPQMPYRRVVMAILISPMIMPIIITATATLVGFDQSLIRAATSLGATQQTTFFKITMPLILPGVISGAMFAFVTSFDEVVVVFVAAHDQQTIPRQMWNGIRESIGPAILSVATILVIVAVGLPTLVEMLRRRSEWLLGVTPS